MFNSCVAYITRVFIFPPIRSLVEMRTDVIRCLLSGCWHLLALLVWSVGPEFAVVRCSTTESYYRNSSIGQYLQNALICAVHILEFVSVNVSIHGRSSFSGFLLLHGAYFRVEACTAVVMG